MSRYSSDEMPEFGSNIESSGQFKGIKNAYKKLIKKKVLWLLKPYEQKQNEINKGLLDKKKECEELIDSLKEEQKKLDAKQDEFDAMQKELKADHEELVTEKKLLEEKCQELKDELEFRTGVLARQVMYTKWKYIDDVVARTEKPTDIVKCKVCGYEAERGTYKTKISQCQFNGGKLVRYICPKCGVIFGPTKFSNLSQEEIDEDYTAHYFGYNETPLAYKEIEAFYMLNPTKEGVYLNYGCGSWSKTIQKLRAEGYNVYGYEPYAPETDNPYMITSKKELVKMKFDGIFSNDLLEHLMDPVEDLKFMKTLLKDPRSKMSHSTACYIYKYEITRFHTHFFTGDSVKVMSERAGLKIVDYRNEMEEKDFICYVYGIDGESVDYRTYMYVSENGEREDNGDITLHENGLLCGPYMVLGSMKYQMDVDIEGIPEDNTCTLRITAEKGRKVLKEVQLHNGITAVDFEVEEGFLNDCEFVIQNQYDTDIVVKKLAMK